MQGKGPISEPFYQLCEVLKIDPLDLLVRMPHQTCLPHQEELGPLIRELTEFNRKMAIGLFGSRARGDAKKYSDWDLGVTGGTTPITSHDYLQLKDRLDDLAEDLPRFVDLINLDRAPPWFLREIDYEPLFLGGDQARWQYFLGVLHGTQKGT
jgi:predicted nucleotidyltransferase